MLTRISQFSDRWASGRLVVALVAALMAFEAITLPFLQRSPGGNIVSLDARFFYTPREAFSTIGSYAGAKPFWIGVYLSWDIVNPILYTLIFSLLISWLFRRGLDPDNGLQRLNILPIGAGAFDLFENACIVTLMVRYPSQLTFVAWLSTVSTMSKVVILGVCMLLVLYGAIKAAANSFRMR
jgi:hypothetical protein